MNLYGADWDIVDGTWTQDAYPDCAINGSPGGLLICKHPAVNYPMNVTVVIQPVAGSRPRIILDATYEPGTGTVSDYLYVEIDVDGNTFRYGRLSTGDIGTFSASISANDSVQAFVTLRSCDDKVTLSAGIDGLCHVYGYVCTTTPGGRYAGLANGPAASANAKFGGDYTHSFQLNNHEFAGSNCGYCDCLCNDLDDNLPGVCVPRTLHGVMTSYGEHDECCGETLEFTLEYDSTDLSPNIRCVWKSSIDIGCGYTFYPLLDKPEDPLTSCRRWMLSDPGGYPGSAFPTGRSPDVCTCCPFYMKWELDMTENPGVLFHYPDDATCRYVIEITE